MKSLSNLIKHHSKLYFLLIALLFIATTCKKDSNNSSNNSSNSNNSSYSFIGTWGYNTTTYCGYPYLESVAFISGGTATDTYLNYMGSPCQMSSPINFNWTSTGNTISISSNTTNSGALIPGELLENIWVQMDKGQTYTCTYTCSGNNLTVTFSIGNGNVTRQYVKE